MRTSFSTNIDWHIDAVSYDVIIWKGMKRMVWERPQDDTRGAQMSPFAIWKQGMAKKRHPPTDENGKKHQNRHFWQKKKRLRQAASRGKWSFSWRNAIWAKKKAPAASRQPKKVQTANFFCRKNDKKHKNLHKPVIHRTFRDVLHQNAQFLKPCSLVIEILRQNP